ncbi:CapA family protein [Salinimicrobium sediminilitoris]|uniref:CapA family protein n=1 Tax=Salinimicrobium sediminilitoris TaxID=2876715 RepID=UPI001E656FD1|nr:CapA family protein [Salinimicrobium sediminilitoris]MCC8359408.1 CapA family protein [Salinimicrobium sediminilitoris]
MLKGICLCIGLLTGLFCTAQTAMENKTLKIFLAGDVMTGRGIDQALKYSVGPGIYEPFIKDARDYLFLAERENGELELPLSYRYIWGDAMKIWDQRDPHLKLINLETSLTTHDEPWPAKGIHYRMHPKNVKLFEVADIDYCSLANNHVLDWKRGGLVETMKSLEDSKIAFSGAGKNKKEAAEPAIFQLNGARVLVYSYGSPGSGIPETWAAKKDRSGVNFLSGFSEEHLREITNHIAAVKKEGDVVIFSIHWGPNWGYNVPEVHRKFAHGLIDKAGVDVIFGHSSHHPMGLEIYKKKLIIYGAGDFINDYEGISGHEKYRGELSLMYFPELDPSTGDLLKLNMVPMEIRKFSLRRASKKDAEWLREVLDRESRRFGLEIDLKNDILEADFF